MNFKNIFARNTNYGGKRSLSSIKFIVIHYTANDGDTDENNGKYFRDNTVYASAHYFVDSDSITISVPENCIAWSVGGNKYLNTNGAKFYGVCTNNNSISIELCDDVKNGVVYPSKETISNAITLVSDLMNKYNIDASHVIRHYDVNGKPCPAYWVDDSKWESEFHSHVSKTPNSAPTNPVVVATKPAKINVQYQGYTSQNGWLPAIVNYNTTDDNGYVGVYGKPIKGFRARTLGNASAVGYLEYRSKRINGAYYGWRRDYDKDSAGDTFSGTLKTDIDRIQFRLVGISGHHVRYRVHTVGGKWLPWVVDYNNINDNGYAGINGRAIDGIQVEII